MLSQACWEKFQTDRDASFLAWLPSWCDDVISSTNDESSWCVLHLPEQHPQLVLELLAACFARIDGSHRARLAHALASGTLALCYTACENFALCACYASSQGSVRMHGRQHAIFLK